MSEHHDAYSVSLRTADSARQKCITATLGAWLPAIGRRSERSRACWTDGSIAQKDRCGFLVAYMPLAGVSEILHEPCATSTIQLAAQLFEPSQHVFLQPRQPYELRRAVRHLSTHHHSTRASAQRRAELRSNHEAPSVPPPVGRRTRQ